MGLAVMLSLLSVLAASAAAAETDDKRAYYQIIMKDGTAIKLYPGVTGGHCIRTNSSTKAEPGGETPDDYVVKLGSFSQSYGLYDWELYLKDFDGQSITYCDGEEGEPFNRDGMKIEVEGENTLTAGAASLRNGVYTAIGRTILKGNRDISFQLSNKYNIYGVSPALGSLTIKSDCSVPGMSRACGIACKDLEIAGTYEPAASMTLTVNLSGNSKGTDRAISVTNRFMITAYASMYLNVQGLNAVYNESKYNVNGTHTKPSDSDKNLFFLIDTYGSVIVNLDTMGLDGNITAFYNYYYHDLNYASHNDGLNELRKVGNMRVTVRNLHPDKLATARANPISIGWAGAKPGWKTEDGEGLLLDELQADGTCIFEYAPGVTPPQIGKVILYDGETGGNNGNIRYRARAYKEYPPTGGATINAPVTAPKVGNDIPLKRWTTVDGTPLTFLSEDGAISDPAILQLVPNSTTKLLAMYDPFTSQPRWEPVFNKEKNRNDGRIRWVTGYGLEPTDSWLVPEDYSLKDDLNPIPVTDQRGAIVMNVKSGETLFSNDLDFRYSVPEGRYRIALRDGDSRWYYSDPFTIHYPLAQPQFTPEGGFVDSNTQTVAITAVEGAEIWYTVYDYTTPTPPDARLYTEPLEIPVTSVRGTVTVKAYAIKAGKKSAWAEAKFSAKPAAPTVTLPDGTKVTNDARYTYYDTAVITAAAPEGVEIRYGTEPLSDKNLGTKLGKDGKFSVSGGDDNLQRIYVCARKTILSGNRTYSAWSDPVSFEMERVKNLTTPILKVDGSEMNSGSTYMVDGSVTVTLARAVGCPVDAEIVYTDKSAIPSYCDVYTDPITISGRATKLDVYMRAWNSETNCYDASDRTTYQFEIKPGSTLRNLRLTNATAYNSTGKQITQAYSGTVVTVKADPAASGRSFHYWSRGTQYLENEKVDKYQPEVTFVMPDSLVWFEAAYTSSTTIDYTKVIVNMGTANVGNSIYLDDPAFRSLSYSWWEGDTVGTEAEKLHEWMTFDPDKTYTAKVTITANKDVSFAANTEVAVAKRTAPNRAFTVPSQKLTKAGQSISFEMHPITKMALTLPVLHPGDKMPTKADIKGLPYGISVDRMTWASTPPAYAGPSGTEYTISELVLNINGTCPQIFTSSTVNGVAYDRDYSAGNGQITLKDIKVPVVAEGVTVSGKVMSYNPNNGAVVRLMQNGVEMYTAAVTTPTAAGGQAEQSFSFASVAAGKYDLVVVKAAHLTYTVKNVEVGDMALDLTKLTDEPYQTITMLCGDINGDRSINVTDLNEVWDAANFNKNVSAATNQLTDINGDGSVNVTDLNVIWDAANFNKGVTACTYNF